MSEIWYLAVDTESLEGIVPVYERPLRDSIELLGLTYREVGVRPGSTCQAQDWEESARGPERIRLCDDEGGRQRDRRFYEDKRWKPGWSLILPHDRRS